MKIEEFKDIILELKIKNADSFVRGNLTSWATDLRARGALAHENISRKACLRASKYVLHDKTITEPWARRGIDSLRSQIQDAKSYDEMMELYTDNKVYKPMIYSYVTNWMNGGRKK